MRKQLEQKVSEKNEFLIRYQLVTIGQKQVLAKVANSSLCDHIVRQTNVKEIKWHYQTQTTKSSQFDLNPSRLE